MVRSYKVENGYDLTVDLQMLYMVIGTLLGSRMGHVFFYEPELLNRNLLEPFLFWKNGLASHGTAVGILLGMFFYSFELKLKNFKIKVKDRHRRGYDYFQVMDRLIIVIALGCALIRVGNFMNSEIIGKPTDRDYGVVFTKPVEDFIKKQLPFVREVILRKLENSTRLGNQYLKPVSFLKVKHTKRKEYVKAWRKDWVYYLLVF